MSITIIRPSVLPIGLPHLGMFRGIELGTQILPAVCKEQPARQLTGELGITLVPFRVKEAGCEDRGVSLEG